MAAMIDSEMEDKIRAMIQSSDVQAAASPEMVTDSVLAYRRNLSETERNLFDAEVLKGRHPSLVVETIEIFAGRQAARSQERQKHLAGNVS
jgi:hypothetical protein